MKEDTRTSARPLFRVFAGAASIACIAAGGYALVSRDWLGMLSALGLIALGVAAAFFAWRGREPRWFRG